MLSLASLPEEKISPRDFCRAWFGIANLSVEMILDFETETDYRAKCVKLLAKVTGADERTVYGWGRNLNFEKIPEHYKITLAYALKLATSQKAA